MILIILIHSIVQVKILHYLLSFLFAFSIENKKSTKLRYKRGKILEKKKKTLGRKRKAKNVEKVIPVSVGEENKKQIIRKQKRECQ